MVQVKRGPSIQKCYRLYYYFYMFYRENFLKESPIEETVSGGAYRPYKSRNVEEEKTNKQTNKQTTNKQTNKQTKTGKSRNCRGSFVEIECCDCVCVASGRSQIRAFQVRISRLFSRQSGKSQSYSHYFPSICKAEKRHLFCIIGGFF